MCTRPHIAKTFALAGDLLVIAPLRHRLTIRSRITPWMESPDLMSRALMGVFGLLHPRTFDPDYLQSSGERDQRPGWTHYAIGLHQRRARREIGDFSASARGLRRNRGEPPARRKPTAD